MTASPTVFYGLTSLGVVHTLISLLALVCGIWALVRTREIRLDNRLGQTYIVTTFLTAVTGLFLFQHGGFGPPHILSILTLVALTVGTVAATTNFYKSWSRYVQVLAYSVTILFHFIPGFTETLTRLPLGAPLVASPDAPVLQPIFGTLFLVFLVGAWFQFRWLKAGRPA